jgi:hypothetical protein
MYIMSCLRFAREVKVNLKMKLGGQATKFAGKNSVVKVGINASRVGPKVNRPRKGGLLDFSRPVQLPPPSKPQRLKAFQSTALRFAKKLEMFLGARE